MWLIEKKNLSQFGQINDKICMIFSFVTIRVTFVTS